jgi:tRNA threonylcarbamoyladenosine biosynthesis protein TsaB
MKILTIRTDKPEAEVGIFEDEKQLEYLKWEAHRELSMTLLDKINEILNKSSIGREELEGIVVFKGPGSFTGLRIGISVANALAYGLGILVVSADKDNWINDGVHKLKSGENEKIALPEYGAPAATTPPKK